MAFKAVNQFGLDAELAQKMNAKYDKALEGDIQMWIEKSTGRTFDKDFAEMLKDGILLCDLVNKFMPGKIKKINKAGGLFRFQENITNFIRVCREVGVPEPSLFTTEALAQMKDMNQVLVCINIFKNIVEGGNGKKKANGKFKPKQMGNGQKKDGNKRKSKWEIKPGGSSGMTKMSMGSSKVMEETKHVDAREMIKRNQKDWKGSNETSKWNDGSKGMEETKHVDAREMIKQNQLAGSGARGEVSALNNGSHGMEQSKHVDPREMIKRGDL